MNKTAASAPPHRHFVGLRACAVMLLCQSGCSHAPSQTILGSFFPAWLLCAAIGIAAAIACRVILGALQFERHLLAPFVFYLAVATAVTLFAWLYRFGQ